MNVLLDASAIMAIILNESNRDKVIRLTKNTVLSSPEIISFEIGNALINLYKKNKITEYALTEAYKSYVSIPFRSIKVDIQKALKIACKYKIYAYDAYYLEIAHRLNLPLLTFDESMRKIGMDMQIDILEDTEEE
jgi:predicted nucleic acid-binding protein